MKATIMPGIGDHISTTCREACRIARLRKKPVSFRFNDIFMVASPRTKPESMAKQFDAIMKREGQRYRMSPPAILRQRERDQEIRDKQAAANGLIEALPLALRTLDETMEWLRAFVPLADDIGVVIPCVALWTEFRDAGYVTGELVGQPPEWFDNRDKMGRYIIGQVMDYLRRGAAPHPMTAEFARRYFELPVP